MACLLDHLLFSMPLGVVPVLTGPLQALLALLPWILLTLLGLLASLFRPRTVWAALKLAWRLKWVLLGMAVLLAVLGAYQFAHQQD